MAWRAALSGPSDGTGLTPPMFIEASLHPFTTLITKRYKAINLDVFKFREGVYSRRRRIPDPYV
jgi:hypothetical protein